MKPFNVLFWENESFQSQQKLILEIEKLYKKYYRELLNLGIATNFNDVEKTFSFSKFPNINKKANAYLEQMQKNIIELIASEQLYQYELANNKNDAFLRHVFGNRLKEIPNSYFNRNLEALRAFQSRKDAGLGLSDRVWNYTKQFKVEMELALDVGLDGRSAQVLSKDVRSLLNEPEKLFRRVKDKYGNLKLSKAAKAYHPGQGVYRSSFKNAERLARTEINMAYRTSDYERFNTFDFVVGFEVHLSNRGSSCPVCNSLKGKYPKDFKFIGWHSNCRCYVTSILSTENEFFNFLNNDLDSINSENEVKKPHKRYFEYLKENKERIKNAKSIPYFLKDNSRYG